MNSVATENATSRKGTLALSLCDLGGVMVSAAVGVGETVALGPPASRNAHFHDLRTPLESIRPFKVPHWRTSPWQKCTAQESVQSKGSSCC